MQLNVRKKMTNKRCISKFSYLVLLFYVLITLFMGTNVRYFLHLNLKGEGIIQRSHYIALPILLLSSLFSITKIKFTKSEKVFFVFSVIIILVERVLFQKTAGLSFMLNNIYEPILLLSLLRILYPKNVLRIRNLVLIFLIIESLIAVYEFITQSFIFADPTVLMSERFLSGAEEMRAASLHGQALQNSFIISITMTCILYSRMKALYRYSFFFLGWIALACFNTRSSILLMGLIFIVGFIFDMKKNKVSFIKRFFLTAVVLIIGVTAANFVLKNGMGGRLNILMGSEDGSSYARIVLIQAIQNLNFSDFMFGSVTNASESIMTQYSLVAIENSFANMILGYGFIFTIVFTILWSKIIWNISSMRFMTLMVLLVMFVLFNVNNAIMTDCPIMVFTILSLFCFDDEKMLNEQY